MNRIAFANKTGIFAWTDCQNICDIPTRSEVAKRFTSLVFSKFNTEADSYNGIMIGATCDFEVNRDVPEDWVSTSKNEDGTVRLEIQAHLCAVPEQLSRGLTIMRFPVWSEEPVGVPLWKCVTVIPRAVANGMQEE